MESGKKNNGIVIFLGLVAAGALGYWLAKHYRKGSLEIGPLDNGSYGVQSDAAGSTVLSSGGGGGSIGLRNVSNIGPFPVIYNAPVQNAIVNGTGKRFPQTC